MLQSLIARRTGLLAARTVQRTQRRKMGSGAFVGNDKLNVKKNKFVEEWNGRREITEKAFEVTPSNLPSIIFCCILFPYGIYHFTRKELIKKGDPRYKQSGLI